MTRRVCGRLAVALMAMGLIGVGACGTGASTSAASSGGAGSGSPRASAAPPTASATMPGSPTSPPGPTTPATGTQLIITSSTGDGQTFTLHVGDPAELHLSSDMSWDSPRVFGSAIRLTAISYLVAPGYAGWAITTVAPGTATISTTGSAICTSGVACPGYARLFRVTINVV